MKIKHKYTILLIVIIILSFFLKSETKLLAINFLFEWIFQNPFVVILLNIFTSFGHNVPGVFKFAYINFFQLCLLNDETCTS